jgi:hypothetical protein
MVYPKRVPDSEQIEKARRWDCPYGEASEDVRAPQPPVGVAVRARGRMSHAEARIYRRVPDFKGPADGFPSRLARIESPDPVVNARCYGHDDGHPDAI